MTTRFGFLLFEGFEDLDFIGPWEMITTWSQKFNGPNELFIINETGDDVTSINGLTVKTNIDFDHCPPLDYLLVPGGLGTRKEVNNQKIISFIKEQASNCKQVLSVCTGAFLLHTAGLLNSKKATTHWASLDRLKAFKEIEVVEQRYIHDANIWSSAGISAGIDMTLAFIADIAGEKIAGDIQLYTEYYPDDKIYPPHDNHLPNYINETR